MNLCDVQVKRISMEFSGGVVETLFIFYNIYLFGRKISPWLVHSPKCPCLSGLKPGVRSFTQVSTWVKMTQPQARSFTSHCFPDYLYSFHHLLCLNDLRVVVTTLSSVYRGYFLNSYESTELKLNILNVIFLEFF